MVHLTPEEMDRKLESCAKWLNSHPGEWNLWPFRIAYSTDKRQLAYSASAVVEHIKNHDFDAFRIDTAFLETGVIYLGMPINAFALRLRVKA